MRPLCKTKLLAVAVADAAIIQPAQLLGVILATAAAAWAALAAACGADLTACNAKTASGAACAPAVPYHVLPYAAVAFVCICLQLAEWRAYIRSPKARMAGAMLKGRNHESRPEQFRAMKKFLALAGKNPMAGARRPTYD